MGNNRPLRPGPIAGDARLEGVATVLTGCRCNPSLLCHCKPPPRRNEETPPSSGDGRRAPAVCSKSARPATRDPFGDLPAELLPTILSKLDAKQAARTSVLSSAWRHAWKHSPKLVLDIAAICGGGGDGYGSCCMPGDKQYRAYVQRFIDTVDTILSQHRGDGVELELRFDDHHLPQVSARLDDWIRFAVSSRAKGVTLHVSVAPEQEVYGYGRDRHELPLQLLDAGDGVSSLQRIQLHSVSLKLPPSHTNSITFPNLRSLGLGLATVSTSDLQQMLANCPNLERLDLYMVYLDDGLRLHRRMPRLLYLRLIDCRVTEEIQLNANKLTTFIFRGHMVPTIINLGETPTLRNVNIQCFKLTLQQAVSSLPNAFHMVRRLSLYCTCVLPKVPPSLVLLENTPRFSNLRYLQLPFCIYPQRSDAALSISYFLESAPLLEELDVKFVSAFSNGGEGPRRSLLAHDRSEYKHLKSLRAREFTGQKDQLELIIHIVENAPALEILTIDLIRHHVRASIDMITEARTRSLSDIRRRATTVIAEKLSAKTKLIIV